MGFKNGIRMWIRNRDFVFIWLTTNKRYKIYRSGRVYTGARNRSEDVFVLLLDFLSVVTPWFEG
jgi:hypothetical protein